MKKTAELYRMVMDKHVCPYGTKSKWLLEREGFAVEDRHLSTREQTDAFKAEHDVETTPVLAVFAVGGALAVALSFFSYGSPFTIRAAEWFVAFSMAMLAMLKLQDVEQFSTMFVGYDLLGQRWVPYAYAYPFLEATAAILMAGRLLPWLSIPIALTIGTIGAVSVFYAVYIQKRSIKCACVGGSSNMPLNFVSLTENLAMIGMGIWMLLRPSL